MLNYIIFIIVICFFCFLSRSLTNPILKHESVKYGSSFDHSDESPNSPIFRANTHNISNISQTSGTFTFPSYMEEPIIVYPGALVCFLQTISSIPHMTNEQVEKNV